MPELQVTVTHGHPLDAVARLLTAKGFKVKEILEHVDVIIGSAPPEVLDRLKRVKGVADVAVQPAIDIGPPEGGQTW